MLCSGIASRGLDLDWIRQRSHTLMVIGYGSIGDTCMLIARTRLSLVQASLLGTAYFVDTRFARFIPDTLSNAFGNRTIKVKLLIAK